VQLTAFKQDARTLRQQIARDKVRVMQRMVEPLMPLTHGEHLMVI
jgi:hypothetical protein